MMDADPRLGLPEWLGRRAMLTPDDLALAAGGRRWTFRQLDEAAAATARLLLRRLSPTEAASSASSARSGGPTTGGTPAPRRVAVLMGNTADFVAAVHAVPKAGAVLVPLNARLTPEELGWQLYDAGAALLLYDEGRAPLARAAVDAAQRVRAEEGAAGETTGATTGEAIRLVAAVEARRFAEADEVPLRERISLDGLHSIVYTSGTTGKPKGALLTAGNFWWNATASALHLGVRPDDVWLACMPLFHVGGLSILLRSVISGMPVLLHESFDAAAVNEAIDEERVTLLSVVAVMLERMLTQRGGVPYPNHLRAVLVGGGPAPRALLERARRLGMPALQTYGLTEAASQVATEGPEDAGARPGSAGKPLFPVDLRIVPPLAEAKDGAGDDGEADAEPRRRDDLPPGEIGEIVVAGPTVSPGYWRRETDGSREAGSLPAPGPFRTGDLGYVDEDGYLYVVDRREDLIVSGGENVYPAEVESVLRDHPAVAEAGVVGLPHDEWGRVPAAAVVLRPGAEADEEDLLRHCRRRLAGYKVPIRITFVSELPRTASGKLLRRRLRASLTGEGGPDCLNES